ncbi:WYL domain-containing protein [Lederbergia citri]
MFGGDFVKGILKRAAGTEQKLDLIYVKKDNQLSQRTIKVLAVTDYSVKAYCYTKRQFRTFKLDNILSVVPFRNRRTA